MNITRDGYFPSAHKLENHESHRGGVLNQIGLGGTAPRRGSPTLAARSLDKNMPNISVPMGQGSVTLAGC